MDADTQIESMFRSFCSLIEVFSGRAINQVPTSWPNITHTQLDLAFTIGGDQDVNPSSFRRRLDSIEMAKQQT